MSRMVLKLDEANRVELELMTKRGENWHERERAQILLLLDQGVFDQEVAHQLGVNVCTVGTTRSRWLESGRESLGDLPRSGAPRRLTTQHVEHLVQWAKAEPLPALALLAQHAAHGGPMGSSQHLGGYAQGVGAGVEAHPALIKKSRDESAFRRAAVEIDALRQQAAQRHGSLAFQR